MKETRKAPLHVRVFTLDGTEYWKSGHDVAPEDHINLDEWLADELEDSYVLLSIVNMDHGGARVRVTTQYQTPQTPEQRPTQPRQDRSRNDSILPLPDGSRRSPALPMKPYPGPNRPWREYPWQRRC